MSKIPTIHSDCSHPWAPYPRVPPYKQLTPIWERRNGDLPGRRLLRGGGACFSRTSSCLKSAACPQDEVWYVSSSDHLGPRHNQFQYFGWNTRLQGDAGAYSLDVRIFGEGLQSGGIPRVLPVRDEGNGLPSSRAFRSSPPCGVRIVLDECVPWPLSKHLAGHVCTSPQRCGWGGFENGDLLRLAEEEHDLFITSDHNLRYQQNLTGRKIAILELSTNDWNTLREHIPDIIASVGSMKSGEFVRLQVGPSD